MTKPNTIQELLIYEWFAVMLLSCLLLGIGALSYLNREKLEKYTPEEWTPEIYVYVSGALDNPGRFFIKEEATFAELLPFLELSLDADKTLLKLDKKLHNGQKIRIPSIYITVIVEGEVKNPGMFQLDRDSRFPDLVKELDFKETADKSKLKSRRKLKDKEKIIIPSV